jgi:hypothetical protein
MTERWGMHKCLFVERPTSFISYDDLISPGNAHIVVRPCYHCATYPFPSAGRDKEVEKHKDVSIQETRSFQRSFRRR